MDGSLSTLSTLNGATERRDRQTGCQEMLNWSLWAVLPPVYSAFTAVGLWVVYFIAVADERIAPLFSEYRGNRSIYPPYISIAGNFPPASCIFSQVLNFAAFVGFLIVVLRYIQLKPRIRTWLNVVSLVDFSLACFGMTLVGNFQLFAETITHNVGTMMTFVLGTLTCWVQSYITLRADINNEGKAAGLIRFLVSGFITVCMILYKTYQFRKLHIQAAECQWALVMFFIMFLGTFAIEFRHIRFQAVCIEIRSHPVIVSEPLSEASRFQSEQL